MIPPRLIVVGHCTSNSAAIFCGANREVAGPGAVARLAWRAGAASGVSDIPLTAAPPYAIGVHQLLDLPVSAQVTYAIALAADHAALPAPDSILAAASPRTFRLLPTGRPLRVALVSCNGAYEVSDPAQRYVMWPRLRAQIESGDVDLVIHAGDQVYSDPLLERYIPKLDDEGGAPPELLGPLIEEFRRIYLDAWTVPEVADVLTSCPSIMMWDDHDICDGWGSNDGDDRPSRDVIFRAAGQAFIEFQASHNPARIDPTSFACAFSHADEAFLLLDGRSHRSYRDGRVLGAAQLDVARRWLAAQPQTLQRSYLVLGIPPVHANAKISSAFTHQKWLPIHKDFAADLRDGWTSPNNARECAVLMDVLFEFLDTHAATEVTILAGDVHVGTVGRLERCDATGTPDAASAVWQVTSSGIGSPPPTWPLAWVLGVVTRSALSLGAGVSGRLHPVMEHGRDVLLRRNFAILRPEEVSFFAEGLDEPLTIALPARAWRAAR